MAHYLIKPRRDKDFYVIWSSVTDSVIYKGDEKFILRATADVSLGDLARANAYGSSAYAAGCGEWDDTGFVVRWNSKGSEEIDPKWLPREKLYDWIINEDDSLLEDFEDG